MNVTRTAEARVYTAPQHHDVHTVRLQGHEAGHTERFWVGLSTYRPGGLAEMIAAGEETVYVVLDGAVVITTERTEMVLGRLDSVHVARGEMRSIHNRSSRDAVLLVAIAHPQEVSP